MNSVRDVIHPTTTLFNWMFRRKTNNCSDVARWSQNSIDRAAHKWIAIGSWIPSQSKTDHLFFIRGFSFFSVTHNNSISCASYFMAMAFRALERGLAELDTSTTKNHQKSNCWVKRNKIGLNKFVKTDVFFLCWHLIMVSILLGGGVPTNVTFELCFCWVYKPCAIATWSVNFRKSKTGWTVNAIE